MNILVTGGDGYVGSHVVKKLIENNHKVIVYDNLHQGHKDVVDKNAFLIEADLKDERKINFAIKKYKIKFIVFSSTSIVYGTKAKMPLTEKSKTKTENPYAETKLIFENMLKKQISQK